ncbi:FUSC family protein [Pseudomonas sp. NPDC007930]|uniref:FUSC family protein n=1 Tax=Pseudomonas sp. NPDC007930 TaxID=3364417 RepID=UPI0036E1D0D9
MLNPFAGRGLDLIYIAKVWLAAVLTYFFALWLEVPQPQTAVISVFILMQPQSGPVLAKSVYRLLGSAGGLGMAVLLIALFGQQGELFIGALALWVGLCCALSAHYRGFTAYSFVLAGYTAAIVGAPALGNPAEVFTSALWRALEIGLAILCCGVVSAVLLPQHSGQALQQALNRRLGELAGVISDALAGAHPGGAQRQLASDAVLWDNLRQLAAYEAPHWGARQGWLQRLNGELMALATTFNAFMHALAAMPCRERAALEPYLQALRTTLEARRGQPLAMAAAPALAEHFAAQQQALPAGRGRPAAIAWRLLDDLLGQLQRCALAHAALEQAAPLPATAPFESLTSPWLSLAAGVRGSVLVAVLGGFWYLSAWPSGPAMLLSAAAAVSLACTTPNPRGTGQQMCQGALLGSVLAFIDYAYVYPALDGFPLLALAIAPPILYGAWLTTRLPTLGIGLGLLVTFASVAIPANTPLYNLPWLLENCLATLVSFAAAAVAGAVLLPSNAPWSWRRLNQALQAQLAFAASAPLAHLRQRLESRTRDLLHHATALAAGAPEVQGQLLASALQAQMAGLAIIEVRQALAGDEAAQAVQPLLLAWAQGARPPLAAGLALLEGGGPGRQRARDYLGWLQVAQNVTDTRRQTNTTPGANL